MKKLFLTSLLTVFTVAGAHAGNVIDGNPLYMPKAGHFFSETALSSASENVDNVGLKETFGYGITDKLMVKASAQLFQEDWFDETILNNAKLDVTYRALENKAWKLDLTAGYGAGDTGIAHLGINGALVYDVHGDGAGTEWFKKDATLYTWTAGVRGGYVTEDFTIAGHINMIYLNEESFAWNNSDKGAHLLTMGIDTHVSLTKDLSLLVGAEYLTSYEEYHEGVGVWELTFGANYNIDATKYIGVYFTKEVEHTHLLSDGNWEVADGFGFGAKFGIDF